MKDFIAVGENIHCTRIYKVGGRYVRKQPEGGYAISYAVPKHYTGGANVPPELAKAAPFRRKVFGVA